VGHADRASAAPTLEGMRWILESVLVALVVAALLGG
jgi:hypothetical protein